MINIPEKEKKYFSEQDFLNSLYSLIGKNIIVTKLITIKPVSKMIPDIFFSFH